MYTHEPDLLWGNRGCAAVYHVGPSLTVSCKLQGAWCCTSIMVRSIPETGSEYGTHTYSLAQSLSLWPPRSLSQVHIKFILFLFFCHGQTGGGPGQCCNLNSGAKPVTASVMSIKAERIAAHCKSLAAGSSAAVYSSSFSEVRGRRGQMDKEKKKGNREGKFRGRQH